MSKKISNWQLFGFIFVGIFGVILHFLYDWTGNNTLFAPFCAVNESTFEHMKLIFFPMLLFSLLESIFIKTGSFWCIKLVGIISGTVMIPTLFYTIGGAFGETPDFVNILIFYLAAYLAYLLEGHLFVRTEHVCRLGKLSMLILIIIAFMFGYFTFNPPEIPLFLDPVSGGFEL